jgi:hypothetical protein
MCDITKHALYYIYSHKECQQPDPEFDAWTDRMIDAYEKFEENLPRF